MLMRDHAVLIGSTQRDSCIYCTQPQIITALWPVIIFHPVEGSSCSGWMITLQALYPWMVTGWKKCYFSGFQLWMGVRWGEPTL